jgi:hypothetical protein
MSQLRGDHLEDGSDGQRQEGHPYRPERDRHNLQDDPDADR